MSREKLFVDSSVIIAALNYPASNSAIIMELASKKQLTAITSEKVFEELMRFAGRHKSERESYFLKRFLAHRFMIVRREEISREMAEWRGKIKEKDLEHLATAKKFGARIIAFDRDFEGFKEYVTPRQFVKSLKLKPFETEY